MVYPKNLERAYVLKYLLQNIKKNTDIISTTGFTSREVHEIRKKKEFKKEDFYMVGARTLINGCSRKFILKKGIPFVLMEMEQH